MLETGTLAEFEVLEIQVGKGLDAAEFSVRIELRFPPDPETDESDLTWGAFGFLFVIGVLSFADARPRESSVMEYAEADEFQPGSSTACAGKRASSDSAPTTSAAGA